MLSYSYEDLAQSFRILLESYLKSHKLLSVDTGEAIGTIETAINANLNSFHNLYDLMSKNSINPPSWYDVPELCTILAIRNARHHNQANRIRSIYNYHRYTEVNPTSVRRYFYVDFPVSQEEGGDCFDVPLSWFDLDLFLSMPKKESRLRPESALSVREYLNAGVFEAKAEARRIKKERIFFNFVPLVLNAGIALQRYIKEYVRPDSVEATCFLDHFETMCPAQTKTHELRIYTFSLPN